jgi:hypothetical protein
MEVCFDKLRSVLFVIFDRCSRLVMAGLLAGSLALAMPDYSEARHLAMNPEMETKVDTHHKLKMGSSSTRTVERGTRSLESRIDAILHPPVEKVENTIKVHQTVSAYDDSIMGTPLASQEQCVNYLLSVNPRPDISVSPQELVSYYYEEGAREGVRPDVAFAQALKETGFFRYGGTVTPDQNNYCGLGTTSSDVKGAYFSSAKLGVRAQIQHLLAYASTRQPSEQVVDPRYGLVRGTYGTRTLNSWTDLNGRWAVPGYTYGQSIMSMFREMLSR